MSDGAMDVMIATSTSREAVARRWADAKAALEQADQALALAKAEYAKCEDAEYHAWQELEGLAGRVTRRPVATPENHPGYVTGNGIYAQQNQHFEGLAGTKEWHAERAARHSLPLKPIG